EHTATLALYLTVNSGLLLQSRSRPSLHPDIYSMDSGSQQPDDCVVIGGNEVWPEAVESFLLDTMIEAKNNGYRVKTTFSKTGWLKIKNALKDKFNKDYKESQLFNKYGQFRITYNRFKALLSHTGMGYNASTGLVTADEEVWALATKAGCNASTKIHNTSSQLLLFFKDDWMNGQRQRG
ncbi:hypothetical protein LINPERHAP2_LOCUS32388, partial [Linum perenne]